MVRGDGRTDFRVGLSRRHLKASSMHFYGEKSLQNRALPRCRPEHLRGEICDLGIRAISRHFA